MNSDLAEKCLCRARPWLWLLLLPCWLFLVIPVIAQAADQARTEAGTFVIELALTPANIAFIEKNTQALQGRRFYTAVNSLKEEGIPRLTIGFFRDDASALALLDRIGVSNPQITELSATDLNVLKGYKADKAAMSDDYDYFVFPLQDSGPGLFQGAIKPLLQDAQVLYKSAMYGLASYHYQLLLHIADDETAAWARELLGLCYERLGLPELAVRQYQLTLETYPGSSGTARVTQRLNALMTAAADAREPLRQADKKDEDKAFYTRGSFGQYSRTLLRTVNNEDREKVMSLLSSNFDIRSSLNHGNHNLQIRLDGYHARDGIREDRNELRLKRAFFNYQHKTTGLGVALGRQKEANSGVFSSFDGLTVSYPVRDHLNVAIITGKPVYFSDIYNRLDFKFYSTSVEWETSDNLEIAAYFNTQTLNGVTSRQALGLRTQYRNDRLNSSFAIDYDMAFSEINNMLLNLSFRALDNLTLGASLGQQRSPFLSGSNILIGQADLDIALYLQSKDNQDALLDQALERTSLNQYATLSMDLALTEKISMLASLYKSRQSDIPSPDFLQGLTAFNDNSMQYSQSYLSMQFNSRGLIHEKESTSLGIRQNKASQSNSIQYFINERIRFNTTLSMNSKISYGENRFDGSEEIREQLRYSIGVNYKPFLNTELSLELGEDIFKSPLRNIEVDNFYLYAGYRVDF